MKVIVKSRVSDEFLVSVEQGLASFPDYYQRLDTTIALGPRLKSVFPDLEDEWRHLMMSHQGRTNTIGLAEFGRSPAPDRPLSKNTRISEGVAHETGHVFDRRVFGNAERIEYFSVRENGPFLPAWEADLQYLEANVHLYENLDEQFKRHMKPGGRGAKETFAEVWANAHGYSALKHRGIYDIRPLWPRCTEVVQDCIRSLG